MKLYDIFLDNLPKIDLHGFDRDSARVKVNDFVDEAYIMGYEKIVIVHGIGTGILKEEVSETLRRNKKVKSYNVVGSNVGCTLVYINKNVSKLQKKCWYVIKNMLLLIHMDP